MILPGFSTGKTLKFNIHDIFLWKPFADEKFIKKRYTQPY